jgi:hypothetical protein
MKLPRLSIIALLSCGLSGCGDFDVVDKSKVEVADRSKQVVISKEEYEQLKTDAALTKQVGRYQLHKEGFRTWRLDTATGRSCLLLTTEADWKKPETMTQNNCAADDFQSESAKIKSVK